MTDEPKKPLNEGWTVLKKGYTPPKQTATGGFQPTTGTLGSPPTTGSGVSKPPEPKK